MLTTRNNYKAIRITILLLVIVVGVGIAKAADASNDIHLNIQLANASGSIQTGTYNFTFNITTASDCTGTVYTNSTELTSDVRGIISYYLPNVSLDFRTQYWLCTWRNGSLVDTSKMGRSPYAFQSSNISSSGVVNDSNINLRGYNVTANYGFMDLAWSYLYNLPNLLTDVRINSSYLLREGNLTNISINFNESLLNATIDSRNTGGNASWNQTLADTLYYGKNNGNSLATNISNVNNSMITNDSNIWAALISSNSSSLQTNGGTLTGNLLINGNLTVLGSYINATVEQQIINGSIIPTITNTFTLGNSTFIWSQIHGYINASYITMATWLNYTDQRYNETVLANNLNSSKAGINTQTSCAASQKPQNFTLNTTGLFFNCTTDETSSISLTGAYSNDTRIEALVVSVNDTLKSNDSAIWDKINHLLNSNTTAFTYIGNVNSSMITNTSNVWLYAYNTNQTMISNDSNIYTYAVNLNASTISITLLNQNSSLFNANIQAMNLTINALLSSNTTTNTLANNVNSSMITNDSNIWAALATAGNASWNQTHANTLYAPIGTGSDNSSWNETYANGLYYNMNNGNSLATNISNVNSTLESERTKINNINSTKAGINTGACSVGLLMQNWTLNTTGLWANCTPDVTAAVDFTGAYANDSRLEALIVSTNGTVNGLVNNDTTLMTKIDNTNSSMITNTTNLWTKINQLLSSNTTVFTYGDNINSSMISNDSALWNKAVANNNNIASAQTNITNLNSSLTNAINQNSSLFNSNIAAVNASVTAGANASWNQTGADLLYYGINNGNSLATNISNVNSSMITNTSNLWTKAIANSNNIASTQTNVSNLNTSLTNAINQNSSLFNANIAAVNGTLNTVSTKVDNVNSTLELTRTKVDNVNSSMITNTTNLWSYVINLNSSLTNNDTNIYTKINNVNASKSGIGNCAAGQVVMNLTSGAPECIAVTSNGFSANQAVNTSSNVTFNYINTTNVNASQNVTALGYLAGQPLTGMLGSGIIQSTESNALSEVNITCTGLVCTYNNFTVRLVSGTSNQFAKYCSITNNSITVTNNQQSVLYIDNNCAVQSSEISNYFNSIISGGGLWDFANVVAYNGITELDNGIGLEQRRMMKQRVINFNKNHLSVTSGFAKTNLSWRSFNLTAGSYIYLMDVVSTSAKDTSVAGSVEILYHNTSNTWNTSDQAQMNNTYCDTGSSMAPCSTGGGPNNRWRRIFFFMVGYNDTTDTGQIHQLLPLESLYYSSAANCLDTTTNPLTYTLPSWYTYSAVPLWAYCARATDTAWTTNWIDLRTTKTSTASGTTDTSIFLTTDGSRNLTGNWNVSGWNISASEFFGLTEDQRYNDSTLANNINSSLMNAITKIDNVNSSMISNDSALWSKDIANANNIASVQTNISNVNSTLELTRTKIDNVNSSMMNNDSNIYTYAVNLNASSVSLSVINQNSSLFNANIAAVNGTLNTVSTKVDNTNSSMITNTTNIWTKINQVLSSNTTMFTYGDNINSSLLTIINQNSSRFNQDVASVNASQVSISVINQNSSLFNANIQAVNGTLNTVSTKVDNVNSSMITNTTNIWSKINQILSSNTTVFTYADNINSSMITNTTNLWSKAVANSNNIASVQTNISNLNTSLTNAINQNSSLFNANIAAVNASVTVGANASWNETYANGLYYNINNGNSLATNISNVNSTLETTRTKVDNVNSSMITNTTNLWTYGNNLNSTKLDLTDQRYNDSVLANNVNSSMITNTTNIWTKINQLLSSNTTVFTYSDNINSSMITNTTNLWSKAVANANNIASVQTNISNVNSTLELARTKIDNVNSSMMNNDSNIYTYAVNLNASSVSLSVINQNSSLFNANIAAVNGTLNTVSTKVDNVNSTKLLNQIMKVGDSPSKSFNCDAGKLIQNASVDINNILVFNCTPDVSGGAGGGFTADQAVNTTSNVTFNNLTVTNLSSGDILANNLNVTGYAYANSAYIITAVGTTDNYIGTTCGFGSCALSFSGANIQAWNQTVLVNNLNTSTNNNDTSIWTKINQILSSNTTMFTYGDNINSTLELTRTKLDNVNSSMITNTTNLWSKAIANANNIASVQTNVTNLNSSKYGSGDNAVLGNISVTNNITTTGLWVANQINFTNAGNVSHYSNGCYTVANTTGLFFIC